MKVSCTIEEFFYGCRKTVTFPRETPRTQGLATSDIVSRQIEERPGFNAKGETLVFPGEGHIRFGKPQGNLIVSFTTVAHEKFKRRGNDLVYTHSISLVDALKSGPIHFTNIDGQIIETAVDEVITPQTEKIIPDKGMPILNDDPLGPIKRNFARGNLIIRFDI